MDQEREKILAMVEEGTLSAAEAQDLLQALEETGDPPQETDHRPLQAADFDWPQMPAQGEAWRRPFNTSLLAAISGAALLLATRGSGGFVRFLHRFLFWPLTIFAALSALITFFSKDSPWLHVRVQSKKDTEFAVSVPFPAGALQSALRAARQRAPNADIQEKIDAAAEILAEMDTGDLRDPLVIEISDEGDSVQIYLN